MRAAAIASIAALLTACSSATPSSLPGTTGANLPQRISRATPKDGIYVSEFSNTSLYGYAGENQRNAPPICGETAGDFVLDIGTDRKGNLVAPSQQGDLLYVYQGPKMCGATAAKLGDQYGLPVDVATANALTGTIAVANIEGVGPISNPPPGGIAICTVAAGCTANLTNPHMDRVAGVALDKGGNCWASATNTSGAAELVYFAHCAGKGRAATGFQNTGYGGLEFDKAGNLLSLDGKAMHLFVYSGCKPACKLVAGPYTLQGQSLYGKLDSHGTTFAAADYQNGRIDIYSYSSKALTFQFSFNQDLSRGADVEGVAFSPAL